MKTSFKKTVTSTVEVPLYNELVQVRMTRKKKAVLCLALTHQKLEELEYQCAIAIYNDNIAEKNRLLDEIVDVENRIFYATFRRDFCEERLVKFMEMQSACE